MTVLGFIVLGLFAGYLAATLGIGGGIVFVPALAVLFDFDQHIAQGTSLAVIVPTSVVGAIAHARAHRVEWATAIPIGLAGIVGGVIGGLTALALDATLLRRLFAVFLVLAALRMLTRTRSEATDIT